MLSLRYVFSFQQFEIFDFFLVCFFAMFFFLINFAFLLPHLGVMTTTTTKIRRLTIDLVFLVSLIACGVYDVGRRREKAVESV